MVTRKLGWGVAFAVALALLVWWRASPRTPSTPPAQPPVTSGPAANDRELPSPASAPVLPAETQAPASDERVSAPQEPRALAAVLGRVTFEGGAAAPDLAVRLFAHSGGALALEQRTDTDGHFEFVVEAGVWQLAGAAPAGFLPWRAELRLSADDAPYLEHVLAPTRPLCVRVWQAREGVVEPLNGARVALVHGLADGVEQRAWSSDEALQWSAVDVDGRAQIQALPDAAQMLYAQAEGFAPASIALDARDRALSEVAQPDGCVHVFLDRAGPTLRGRVLGVDGQPLQGALVSLSAPLIEERGRSLDFGALGARTAELVDILFASATTPPLAQTDARGEFVLSAPDLAGVPRRALALVVHPRRPEYPHHYVQELDFWTLGDGQVREIRLAPGHEYEFEFVDDAGVALDGAVSVRDPDGRAYAPLGRMLEALVADTHAERFFATENGRLRLRHVGGVVVVSLASGGALSEEEQTVTLPRGGSEAPVRIVVVAN